MLRDWHVGVTEVTGLNPPCFEGQAPADAGEDVSQFGVLPAKAGSCTVEARRV